MPTIAQARYPDFAADIWTAVLVPSGTPRPIVDTLQHEIAELVTSPQAKQRMAPLGYRPVANTPHECAKYIAAKERRWAKVIQQAGLKVR